MKQVTTGVNGLDAILDGGFLRPSIVLVAGMQVQEKQRW